MRKIPFSLLRETKIKVMEVMQSARRKGNIKSFNRCCAILSISDDKDCSEVAAILNVSEETVCNWFMLFIHEGIASLTPKKSPGRPKKLNKEQQNELGQLIDAGPTKAGFPGACWRSPMIQDLIRRKFGQFYCVAYIAQLLRTLGFSYQKARFASDHHDPIQREEWVRTTWPRLFRIARQKRALLLFGDEASFPQWGTLTYTWARRGQTPTVPTCGIRKSYKVFGLIDFFSGRFFAKGHIGRLNSDSYKDFLAEVLQATGQQHIIVIQDGARYHTSKAINEFVAANSERLTVCQLPSYSPDFNPIEKLWKEIKKDGTHLHYFPTFESLLEKVDQIIEVFKTAASKVTALFGMYYELPVVS